MDHPTPDSRTGGPAARGPLGLFRFLKRYWVWVALAPLAMFVEARMDLQQPLYLSRIVDEGVVAGNPELIRAVGWKMLLVAFAGSLGGCLCTIFSSQAALGFGNDLRKALFRATTRLSFSQTDRFTAGSLTTRLTNDITTVQHLVVLFTRMLLRAPIMLFGSIWLVIETDWRLSLPLVASAPILSWLVVHFMRRLMPMFRERQKRTDELSSSLQESLVGIRVVKAFANEAGEQSRFRDRNGALTDVDLRTELLRAPLWSLLSFVQQFTVVVILYFAAREADAGLVKVGQIAAIVNWSSRVMGSLVMLSFHAMHFSRAMISARRVAEVLDTEPEIRDGSVAEPPADGSVEFRGVSFSYGTGTVLDGVSFRAAPGEQIAVVGGTGSGKTSLVNLVPRFYEVSEGAVLVGGRDVRDYGVNALRGAMGIVLQNPRLFVGTIEENVRWGKPDATHDEVVRAVRLAQAESFVKAFPDGYATRVAQGGVTLSGGQKQRLAIARALVRRPKILILDDATSAVDPATERALRAALREAGAGTTVLTVAQRVDSVKDADRILVLDRGRIVGTGSHEELLRTCPTYREIVDSQSTD